MTSPAALPARATDWDRYYRRPARTAAVTRKITAAALLAQLRRFAPQRPVVAELGGADSCFFDLIWSQLRPQEYHVVDNNRLGLDRLRQRVGTGEAIRGGLSRFARREDGTARGGLSQFSFDENGTVPLGGATGVDSPVPGQADRVILHEQDVLRLALPQTVDVAFSVGLIEHFTPEETASAVRAHFEILKPGGIALVSFPTPTWLYRLARRAAELTGKWMFPDERPLRLDEVAAAASPHGRLLFRKILWPIVFTQCLTVWRKV
jgi:SAM-dependent methyltransferase